MKKNPSSEPVIRKIEEPVSAVGLSMQTGLKTVFKDVSSILRKYMQLRGKTKIPGEKDPWEYVSLSINFHKNQTWDYFTGHVVTHIEQVLNSFVPFEIPSGTYAVFPVSAKFRMLLGIAMGKTKRYIYNDWLPNSGYTFAGYEFEYNNSKMFDKNPNYIELYVGIIRKR